MHFILSAKLILFHFVSILSFNFAGQIQLLARY